LITATKEAMDKKKDHAAVDEPSLE